MTSRLLWGGREPLQGLLDGHRAPWLAGPGQLIKCLAVAAQRADVMGKAFSVQPVKMDRSTVAMLGGEVRGANAFSRPVRMESGAATSAPYTDGPGGRCQAGQNVSVGGRLPLSR